MSCNMRRRWSEVPTQVPDRNFTGPHGAPLPGVGGKALGVADVKVSG